MILPILHRRNPMKSSAPEITVPLGNIRNISAKGVTYQTESGEGAFIPFRDAIRGWCKSKNTRRGKVRYVCDMTKMDGFKLIFHTAPKVTFTADNSQAEKWFDVISHIRLFGYAVFDWD